MRNDTVRDSIKGILITLLSIAWALFWKSKGNPLAIVYLWVLGGVLLLCFASLYSALREKRHGKGWNL